MNIVARQASYQNIRQAKKEINKILDKYNIEGYLIGLSDNQGNNTIFFRDGMPGNIGMVLALRCVDTISKSLNKDTQETLSHFQRTVIQEREVKEWYDELQICTNDERREELEQLICEALQIPDIGVLDEGPEAIL